MAKLEGAASKGHSLPSHTCSKQNYWMWIQSETRLSQQFPSSPSPWHPKIDVIHYFNLNTFGVQSGAGSCSEGLCQAFISLLKFTFSISGPSLPHYVLFFSLPLPASHYRWRALNHPGTEGFEKLSVNHVHPRPDQKLLCFLKLEMLKLQEAWGEFAIVETKIGNLQSVKELKRKRRNSKRKSVRERHHDSCL